jgi:hypothetical protein
LISVFLSMAHGYGAHNFRDLAKTVLHLKAKKDGIDMAWVKFAMGHIVDKLGYDQFYKDQEYTLNQFRIAERYLNIMSGREELSENLRAVDERLKERDAEIAKLREQVEKQKPNMDKWFEENIETIIKKFNEYGVDMKIRSDKKRT